MVPFHGTRVAVGMSLQTATTSSPPSFCTKKTMRTLGLFCMAPPYDKVTLWRKCLQLALMYIYPMLISGKCNFVFTQMYRN